jgi:hypothetical protein
MGGASVWHLTAHYADLFAATSPGAGFAETAVYQKLTTPEKLAAIPWYEQKLWKWYDATAYASNFANVPCIAYAGELDPQKQSGDVMENAMAAEGLRLERIRGPKTGHKYEPGAKKDLDRRLDEYAAKGRVRVPHVVRFTTWTLRCNQQYWVRVDGLERHWEEARVNADVTGAGLLVKTQNVTGLTLAFPKDHVPLPAGKPVTVILDGTALTGPPVVDGAGWTATFARIGGQWTSNVPPESGLRKKHGLTGPIDDAFLDSFVIVKPTGKAANEKAGAWAATECDRAVKDWRSVFRGEARVITDDEVDRLNDTNLVLFGDPSSNRFLAKIADKLPIKWTKDAIVVGSKSYPADRHAVVMIYPNPMNPDTCIVLNSGFTFREGFRISNARQTPRLPDYAIIDLTEAPSLAGPGKIAEAGFFGEKWELLPDGGHSER